MRWLVTAGSTATIILHCLFSVASHPKRGALLFSVEQSETLEQTLQYRHKCPKLHALLNIAYRVIYIMMKWSRNVGS